MELKILKIEKTIGNEDVVIFPVLIQFEDRNYLIDCGYEETVDELVSELNASGLALSELTGVIISHDDHDHLGGLSALKNRNKALKIYCGSIETDSVSGKIKSERLVQAENSLCGIPEEYKEWALGFIDMLKRVQRVSVDECFEDNEVFENEMLILHTPGHTKGHISFYFPKEKILIAGDAVVVENGEPDIANPAYTLDIKQAVSSVEKIKALAPAKIICYHGGVFDDRIDEKLTGLIDRYRQMMKN